MGTLFKEIFGSLSNDPDDAMNFNESKKSERAY
jgi:hypothetical protein